MKSGNLNFLEPSGPLQAGNGTAYLYHFFTTYCLHLCYFVLLYFYLMLLCFTLVSACLFILFYIALCYILWSVSIIPCFVLLSYVLQCGTSVYYCRTGLLCHLYLKLLKLHAVLDGFGGLVVSILATGTRVRGFKPGRSRWIFRASGKSLVCLPSEGK